MVTSRVPSMARASWPTSSGLRASLTPPALPRPPAWTWALTTQILAAEPAGRRHGLGRGGGNFARRDLDAKAPKQLFGLIFVEIHSRGDLPAPEGRYCGGIVR